MPLYCTPCARPVIVRVGLTGRAREGSTERRKIPGSHPRVRHEWRHRGVGKVVVCFSVAHGRSCEITTAKKEGVAQGQWKNHRSADAFVQKVTSKRRGSLVTGPVQPCTGVGFPIAKGMPDFVNWPKGHVVWGEPRVA